MSPFDFWVGKDLGVADMGKEGFKLGMTSSPDLNFCQGWGCKGWCRQQRE
jgi:hypothetical protein